MGKSGFGNRELIQILLNRPAVPLILVLLIGLPLTNYNVLAATPFILIFFVKKVTRYAVAMSSLLIFLIVLNFETFEISNFKYFTVILLYLVFRGRNDILRIIHTSCTIVLVVLVSEYFITDLVRSYFRASNQSFHYERMSSLFLYPGDLGSFGAIVFSLELFLGKDNMKLENYLYLTTGTIFVLVSQSRMALFQVVISIILLSFSNFRMLLSLLLCSIVILKLNILNLSYLFRQDLMSLLLDFNPLGSGSHGNKRAEEFINLLSSSKSEDAFYEGSVPSLVARFGSLGLILLMILLIPKLSRILTYKNSIVLLPLFLTSLIGAPFERPKLMLFSIAASVFMKSKIYCEKKV